MTRRGRPQLTRTWHAQPLAPAESALPVAQVRDPAVRDILLTRRRALLAGIENRLDNLLYEGDAATIRASGDTDDSYATLLQGRQTPYQRAMAQYATYR